MKRLIALLVLVIVGLCGWHIYLARSMAHDYRLVGNATFITVNPATDVVWWDLKIEVDTLNKGNPPVGHMAEVTAMDQVKNRFAPGIPSMEEGFNLYARQYFDVYALLLPYRVIIDPYK